MDNFLQSPAGTIVPLGSLDHDTSAWQAEPSGVVLDIISETGGLADVDVTGDGVPDTGSALSSQGITDQERAKLAELYDPGQSLWRVQLAHFTKEWDCNWGGGPPPDATGSTGGGSSGGGDPPPICGGGGGPGPGGHGGSDSTVRGASTIHCESQVLREAIPIAGTPYYSTTRAIGPRASNSRTV